MAKLKQFVTRQSISQVHAQKKNVEDAEIYKKTKLEFCTTSGEGNNVGKRTCNRKCLAHFLVGVLRVHSVNNMEFNLKNVLKYSFNLTKCTSSTIL